MALHDLEDLTKSERHKGPGGKNPSTEVDHGGAKFRGALKGAMDAFAVDDTDGYRPGPREARLERGVEDKGRIRTDRRALRPGGSVKWTDARSGAMEE